MKNLPPVDGFTVEHLPIITAYAHKIGIVDIINTLIPTQMAIDPGTVILGMVLDTLSGRSPLYKLNKFFEHQDTELLLGKKVDPLSFSDHTVGRVLDRIYDYGAMKTFSEIAMRALNYFNISHKHLSFDTTSVTVQGDYLLYSKEKGSDNTIKIVHGHSKDHRPDLKQFLVKMLCVDRTIPVFGQTEDGNGSDKTINNEVLSSISKYMAKNGIHKDGFIYIADSAMVTKKNLEKIGDQIQFISRLPANYKACSQVIKEAIIKDDWTNLGKLSEALETQNRPTAVYKSWETEITLHGRSLRAIVVHSSAHDKRRQKRIDRELKSEYADLSKQAKALAKQKFFCRADAEKAAIDLKNTPIVNCVFLKKAERIEVLTLVLLLSLLIWRLIEYNMRRYAKEKNRDLPGWEKRRTYKPTSFMLMSSFRYQLILKIGKHRKLAKPLTNNQLEYLRALGLNSKIFTVPGG